MKKHFSREEKIRYYQGVKAYLLRMRKHQVHEGYDYLTTEIAKVETRINVLRLDSYKDFKRQA